MEHCESPRDNFHSIQNVKMKILLTILFTFICFCQAEDFGLGEICYSQDGTQLKCKEGLSCSAETKTCQHTNICYGMMCPMYMPVCTNGMTILPRDPSKCRCCGNTCGYSKDETGCRNEQKCNSVTGRCE